jgi:hypothetical protein
MITYPPLGLSNLDAKGTSQNFSKVEPNKVVPNKEPPAGKNIGKLSAQIRELKSQHIMGMALRTFAIAGAIFAAIAGTVTFLGSGVLLATIPFVVIGGLSLAILWLTDSIEINRINKMEKALKES